MAKKDSNGNPLGKRRGLRSHNAGVADWETANETLVKRSISQAGVAGGAIRFGYTSDGGAYSIGIYGDGDPYTVYVSPAQDIDITLQDIIDLFEGIADDLKKASGAKQLP